MFHLATQGMTCGSSLSLSISYHLNTIGCCEDSTDQLPECTCSSYETGATAGTEMCQFGDNCATATNFDGSCPEGASTQCVLVVETTTTEGAYTCGSTMEEC